MNARTQGSTHSDRASIYYNLNAGDPTKWLYVPDLSQPEYIGPDVGERERPAHLAG